MSEEELNGTRGKVAQLFKKASPWGRVYALDYLLEVLDKDGLSEKDPDLKAELQSMRQRSVEAAQKAA